jgi:hypothetical protein
MKKSALLLIFSISLLLSGCDDPNDKEYGDAVLFVIPTVFLISLGFQYLFFRLWKKKFPQLTFSWLPNIIFYIILIVIARFLGDGNSYGFGDMYNIITLVIFGTSFLTVLFLITRIGLSFNPSRTFTWASILTMSFYMLPVFPMIAGLTEGTFWSNLIDSFWVTPGGFGLIFLLVFLALFFEALSKTGNTTDAPNK